MTQQGEGYELDSVVASGKARFQGYHEPSCCSKGLDYVALVYRKGRMKEEMPVLLDHLL